MPFCIGLLMPILVAIVGSSNNLKVYHNYLASSYHMGIISGFMLISSYLESVASTGRTVRAALSYLNFLQNRHGSILVLNFEVRISEPAYMPLQLMVKAVVIGLGAGLLPMFLHGCMPFLDIEVG
ncbi:hypothetical protein CK203_029137 [Vitis vinifera]|uniref:NADH:quinone oxidoreductase/Mrp antiporter membrane subunit domain-containing protein n=1 Tax=Vitis vinifera TaxID=29760 RepID=A0A438ISY7_VITVI|nr:hypothetical protein CK203_029137 [Vitis vinifera]